MLEVKLKENGVSLHGRLTARYVHIGFQNTPQFSGDHCEIDLASVEKVDSAGLALLVYWYNKAQGLSCQLQCKNYPDKLKEISDLAGLSSILNNP